MKKNLPLILIGLILGTSFVPAIAQTSSVVPDSRLVTTNAQLTTFSANPHEQTLSSSMNNRIPVKVGDSVIVSAMVLDQIPHKGRFWKSMAKATVPAFVLSNLGNYKPASSGDQPPKVGHVATFGAGMAVIPGAIELAQIYKKKETFVSLTVYDANNQPMEVVSDFMTKAARKDWEELRIGYRIKKDGFVEITGNKSNTNGFYVETYGENYWIKASISSYRIVEMSPLLLIQSILAVSPLLLLIRSAMQMSLLMLLIRLTSEVIPIIFHKSNRGDKPVQPGIGLMVVAGRF